MPSKRPVRRATLIQDIGEFSALVGGYMREACAFYTQLRQQPVQALNWKVNEGYVRSVESSDYTLPLLNHSEVLRWIICEELELCYLLFTNGHVHNHEVYSQVHNNLNGLLDGLLSRHFTRWIKGPLLYDEHLKVDVVLHGRDLYIHYFSYNLNLPFNPVLLP